MLEQIIQDIDSRSKDTIALLEQLVNIDSSKDCFEGNAKVAQVIGDQLNQIGFEVKLPDGTGNMYPCSCE